MFANLAVLCPELIKDLKVESWRELDPFDAEELRKSYKEQFVPWYDQFIQALKVVQNPEEKKSADDGQPTAEK